MNNNMKSKATRLTARRRLKNFMARAAVIMSGIAVFCVVYTLVTPGMTAEWPLQCELEEHVHDESCYTLMPVEAAPAQPEAPAAEPELICGMEETEGHTHSEGCYTAVRGALICTDESHEHTDDCYEWTQELTCGMEEAEGHTHSESCYAIPEAPAETAAPAETPAPTETEAPTETYVLTCGKEEHTHSESCYILPAEDVHYLCGYLTEHTHDESCYFESGELKCGIPEHTHSDSCLMDNETLTLDETYQYQTDIADIRFHITGEAVAPVDPEAAEEAPLEFNVIPSEDQAEYDEYEALVSEDGDVLAMQILHFSLTRGGHDVDLNGCEITADITPTEMLRDYAENGPDIMTLDVESESEESADMGILLAASGSDGAYEAAALSGESDGTVTVPVTGRTLRTAAISGANPKFTVQYYAWLSRVTQTKPATGTYTELDIINTDNGGNGEGGKMPYNGTGDTYPYLVNLYVGNDGRLATTTELTKIYKDETFQYFNAPGLLYFNIVINNTESNYNTFQIWVLKEGRDAESVNPDDWEIHQYDPKLTRFTNRPETVQPNNGYILIEDGTVIRLVYTPADESVNVDARFYDYDISNGYTDSTHMTTTKHGINTPISGSGTQLTFGNGNAGVDTSLSGAHWTDPSGTSNMPNQMNRVGGWGSATVGYKGCTYGMVTGYDAAAEDVIYTAGLKSNPLFGKSNSKGKTIEPNINNITFSRVGDTYTLTSVPGTDAQNLDIFSHPGSHNDIWTNNFWPMDNAASAGTQGHDLKFGGSITKYGGTGSTGLPVSDNGIEHNTYFGMHFGVSFELTKSYVGPLEYYFFGDDDMWVFLEHPDGTTELICDIGGVHSSVGEYVNLWDYIKPETLEGLGKDPVTGKEQTALYKLKFFYTERGASGSTCWMQFTLPTVVGLDLDEYIENKVTETTGALRIEKQLDGVENTSDFEFKLILRDKDGKEYLPDNYLVRGANGELLEGDNAKEYIANGDTFKLKAGDVLVIHGLPTGTRYEITEQLDSTAGYSTTIEVTDGGSTETRTIDGTVAEGSVIANATSKVVFINHASYELPATGGSGTFLWYAIGLGLLVTALSLMYNQRRKAMKGGAA